MDGPDGIILPLRRYLSDASIADTFCVWLPSLDFGGPLNQYNARWNEDDLAFDLVTDVTDDPVVTANVSTPDGVLTFMAEAEDQGSILLLRGLHVQGARANVIGPANLMVLAQVVMERMGYDELVVEGAPRTTGANPGRRPRPLRFSRRVRSPAPSAPGGP